MPNEVEIKITSDDLTGPGFTSVLAKLALLKKEAKDIGKSFSPEINTGNMTSSLIQLKQKMQALGIADIADINQSPGKITSNLMLLKRLIQQAGISDILDINVSDSKMESSLAKLKQIVDQNPITIDTQFAPFKAPQQFGVGLGPGGYSAYLKSQSALWASFGHMAAPGFGGPNSNLQIVNQQIGLLKSLAMAAGLAMGSGGGGNGGGTGILGLSAAWGGFNKALANRWGWNGAIGGIGLWHIALDGAIEAIIIAVSSMAALAAGAMALAPTFQDIYTHLKAVNTVNSALGSTIPPLTDKFASLQQQLAPQGIEIYGGALYALQRQTGSFGRAMAPVVNLFTTWTAKFDLWVKGYGSTGKIFQAGIGFLTQLGHILGTVGMGIGNLIKADPGIAHFLLDLLQGTASAFNMLTKLPQPLLYFALGLHGAWVWGRVLLGLLLPLVRGLKNMWTTLLGFAGNPWAWAAVGAAAFIYLAATANQADAATKTFIANQNAGLAQVSGYQAYAQSIADVASSYARIKTINWQQIKGGMDEVHQAITRFQYFGGHVNSGLNEFFGGLIPGHGQELRNSFKDFYRAISEGFGNRPFSALAGNDIQALRDHINSLLGSQKNMVQSMVAVRGEGFSVAQSWALLGLAGVKLGDNMKIAIQKVNNLLNGYKNLGVQGGMLSNSVNAITFGTLQQQSQVTALNTAWQTFFTTVTGGISSFVTFEGDMTTLKTDMAGVKGNLNGIGTAALTARGQFVTAAGGASTLMQNLTLLSSAAGLGTKGANLLTQAGKDLVQIMAPSARGSAQLQDALFALAQQGGYPGANSLKQMTTWAGRLQNPTRNLNGILTTLTGAAAGLTHDVQALSTALGTTLSNAMATAIFAAAGGQKALDAAASAAFAAHGQLSKMVPTAKNVANQFITLTGNTAAAKNEFITFYQGLGLTRGGALALWKMLGTLQGFINRMHGANIYFRTNAGAALSSAQALASYLAGMNGMTVNTYIQTHSIGPQNQGLPGGIPGGLPHKAVGGYAGGWTVVNERGNELINLPNGSYVHTAAESARMMGGSNGPPVVHLHFKGGGTSSLDRALFNWFVQNMMDQGGGNVQAAFGDDFL